MADLFTSLVAIAPLTGRVAGEGAVPGASPQVKGPSIRRAVASTGFGPAGHAPTGNTRLLWKLDEAGGTDTVADVTGTYPLPTPSGVVLAESGQIANGRHFNAGGNSHMAGASDAATVAKLAHLTGAWTLGFWIKVTTVNMSPTEQGVMTLCEGPSGSPNLNSAVFYLTTAFGVLIMGSTTASGVGTNISFVGQAGLWTHCVVGWDGFAVKSWRNGVAQTDPGFSIPSPSTLTTPTWVLGRGGGSVFAGQDCVLDDIWFENVLLTTPQVLADYQRGTRF